MLHHLQILQQPPDMEIFKISFSNTKDHHCNCFSSHPPDHPPFFFLKKKREENIAFACIELFQAKTYIVPLLPWRNMDKTDRCIYWIWNQIYSKTKRKGTKEMRQGDPKMLQIFPLACTCLYTPITIIILPNPTNNVAIMLLFTGPYLISLQNWNFLPNTVIR